MKLTHTLKLIVSYMIQKIHPHVFILSTIYFKTWNRDMNNNLILHSKLENEKNKCGGYIFYQQDYLKSCLEFSLTRFLIYYSIILFHNRFCQMYRNTKIGKVPFSTRCSMEYWIQEICLYRIICISILHCTSCNLLL